MTLKTVKKHVSHIFDKLGAGNRTEADAHSQDLRLALVPVGMLLASGIVAAALLRTFLPRAVTGLSTDSRRYISPQGVWREHRR